MRAGFESTNVCQQQPQRNGSSLGSRRAQTQTHLVTRTRHGDLVHKIRAPVATGKGTNAAAARKGGLMESAAATSSRKRDNKSPHLLGAPWGLMETRHRVRFEATRGQLGVIADSEKDQKSQCVCVKGCWDGQKKQRC